MRLTHSLALVTMILVSAPLFIGTVRAEHDKPWEHLELPGGDIVLWCVHVRIPPSIEQYCSDLKPPGTGDPKVTITPSVEGCLNAQIEVCVDTNCDPENEVCLFGEGPCVWTPRNDVCAAGIATPYCSNLVTVSWKNARWQTGGSVNLAGIADSKETMCAAVDTLLP